MRGCRLNSFEICPKPINLNGNHLQISWTIMVKCGPRPSLIDRHDLTDVVAADAEKPERYAPVLPVEIIHEIYDQAKISTRFQKCILPTMCLVCRSWYAALIGFLYNFPHMQMSRFRRFVDVICSPTNAKTPYNGLADLVHSLDLVRVRESAAKTLMKRLLNRVRHTLEFFVAPRLFSS